MKKKLLALWLVVVLLFAAFSGGVTTAPLIDSKQGQVVASVGNVENAGNVAPSGSGGKDSGDPGISYVAFVSEDSKPGVSWSVDSRNEAGEPTTIYWTTEIDKHVDYVVVGYTYEGHEKVNIYDYSTRDGPAAQATSLGSANPDRTVANVTSYNVSSALGVDEIAAEANSITAKELDDANTNNITASTTLKIAYDANNDEFTGELAGESSYTLPKAIDDSYNTTENVTLEVNASGVLGNDTPGNATPSIPLGSGPSNGTVTLHADGSFTYTPDSGFTGEDSFTYRLGDDITANTATVTITVSGSQ